MASRPTTRHLRRGQPPHSDIGVVAIAGLTNLQVRVEIEALMIVFLHGVPETASLWDDLRTALQEPSIALSLPGFGAPRPPGFTSTKDDYLTWLIAELEALGEPVDLVGHDWGAILTLEVARRRSDLLTSWTVDLANALHPNYVWHGLADIWQTPEVGEQFWTDQLATSLADRSGVFQLFGVPEAGALKLAEMADAQMAECILSLYRSATPNPHADWGGALTHCLAPGTVLITENDAFGDAALATGGRWKIPREAPE
ncbi:MAG: alpha/beta hydrolase [Actinomycetes bacterium]